MPIPIAIPIIAGAIAVGQSIYNAVNADADRDSNRRLNRITWDREDNAVQRRVADLKAAGLSPTLAAGSAAQTSTPIKAERRPLDIPVQDLMQAGLMAQQSAKIDAEIAQVEANTQQAQSQATLNLANTGVAGAMQKKAQADTITAAMDGLTKIHNLKLAKDTGTATTATGLANYAQNAAGWLNKMQQAFPGPTNPTTIKAIQEANQREALRKQQQQKNNKQISTRA